MAAIATAATAAKWCYSGAIVVAVRRLASDTDTTSIDARTRPSLPLPLPLPAPPSPATRALSKETQIALSIIADGDGLIEYTDGTHSLHFRLQYPICNNFISLIKSSER